MTENFLRAFNHLIDQEGGYSDNAADNGGKTMYGITENVARANGYTGPMRSLDLFTAKLIYESAYWQPMQCEQMTFALADFLFDMAVNSGVGAAAKALQRAVGTLPDGIIGEKTLMAVRMKDPDAIVRLIFVNRAKIFAHHPDAATFENGWFARLFDVTARYFTDTYLISAKKP